MEIAFSDSCRRDCAALPICELLIERVREIEQRAERIGALATEGRIRCRGPQPKIDSMSLEGIDYHELCAVEPRMPAVKDVQLAEEIAAAWPTAPLQRVLEG